MDTFKINIKKYDSSPYYTVYTCRDKVFLFYFYQSPVDSKLWYFVIPEYQPGHNHFVTSEQVPREYILEFSKSLINIRYGIIDFNVQMTVKTKRLLKIK